MFRFSSPTAVTLSILVTILHIGSSLAGDVSKRARAREIGIEVGVMAPGEWNAITDVPGVRVGHTTLIRGDNVRTGVTAILPRSGNLFREKVPAAVYIGNGFGKLAGYTQVQELGNIETPIILTNTLSVGIAMEAVVRYTLDLPGNEAVRSVNALVGETNDGYLNDIRGTQVTAGDVLGAIRSASPGPVREGSVGAGTGTRAFDFKGGIGTASRLVPVKGTGTFTVGVLVQSNYGGILDINGAPVGRELRRSKDAPKAGTPGDGSCMIVVATDAPLSFRNLERLAARALHGMARTGSFMSNGSGDYVVAFSTAYRIPYDVSDLLPIPPLIPNDWMTPFFQAVIEATQEAVYNSLFMATEVVGQDGRTVPVIPIPEVLRICEKYDVLRLGEKLPWR